MRDKFIVVGNMYNQGMAIDNRTKPKNAIKGVLMYGKKAQVFTRSEAVEAIKRTKRYEEEKGFKWETSKLKIVPLQF